MKIKLLLIASLLCAVVSFTGCGSATAQLAEQTAVQFAVLKFSQNNPERSAQIISIVTQVRALAGGEKFDTVALLVAFVKLKINWSKLDAADTSLVNNLLAIIQSALEEKVGTGILTPEKLLVVDQVLGWIETAGRPPTATGVLG